MEQHVKTDLRVMVKEAGETGLTSCNTPAPVEADISGAQALQLATTLLPLMPVETAFSSVLRTDQVMIFQDPPQGQ